MNEVLGVLVQREGLLRLGEHYTAFTGDDTGFPTVAHDKKIAVTQEALGSDVNRLTSLFVDICEGNRDQRDFTRAEIRRAIREVASCFAVYRTYVVPERNEVTDEDRLRIERAIVCAKDNRADIDGGLFDFMRDVLTLKVTGKVETEFVYRFQQFTSPVMAKGVEDTAFYCSNRLIAMNEVGGDPDCGGFKLDHFHAYNAKVQATFPTTMTTLSTHDTKRSDDVRARLLVLSEIPDAFAEEVRRWSAMNAKHRSGDQIDTGTEWFLYQTLVGAWPISAERMREYMMKAMREAKVRTSWVANNGEYEGALNEYIDALLGDEAFVADMDRFVAGIQVAGRTNSLSQTLLKYTAPGVPDIYQGGEIWDFSLVDPDNRRPVDYALRAKMLAEIKTVNAADVAARLTQANDAGLPKLWVVHHALELRREHPEWFGAEAAYTPLTAKGAEADRAIAFMRGKNVLTLAPRWTHEAKDWGETSLRVPAGTWRNRLTGDVVRGGDVNIAELLGVFPVALLMREA
jgi:(1->4)-alpha-D-glucan 1-alpha-D-glucosylmutase